VVNIVGIMPVNLKSKGGQHRRNQWSISSEWVVNMARNLQHRDNRHFTPATHYLKKRSAYCSPLFGRDKYTIKMFSCSIFFSGFILLF